MYRNIKYRELTLIIFKHCKLCHCDFGNSDNVTIPCDNGPVFLGASLGLQTLTTVLLSAVDGN